MGIDYDFEYDDGGENYDGTYYESDDDVIALIKWSIDMVMIIKMTTMRDGDSPTILKMMMDGDYQI